MDTSYGKAPQHVALVQQQLALIKEQLRALKTMQYWHYMACRWGSGLVLCMSAAPWLLAVGAQWPLQVALGLLSTLSVGIAVALWRGSAGVNCQYQQAIDQKRHELAIAQAAMKSIEPSSALAS